MSSSYLLTAWASGPAPSVNCFAVPCGCDEKPSLYCDCPAPKCEDGSEALTSASGADEAIIESLRLPAVQEVLR